MASGSRINQRLDQARKELLDLSTRNRLVHTPLDRARSKMVRVFDEQSDDVFRVLVQDGRAMSFLPGKEDAPNPEATENPEEPSLPQPEADEVDAAGAQVRFSDARLQTALSSEALQKKLLGIYYDARTFKEEQGVNILYLALGFLEWYETPSADKPRYAPLVLLPVELQRQSVGARFRLVALDEEISTNLSIQAKLEAEFRVKLPELPALEELDVAAYFQAVSKAVEEQPRWKVLPNEIVLGFFSFAKFLMYRDLDPATWKNEQGPDSHPLVVGLLDGGLPREAPFCGDDEKIDPYIAPADMVHIVDCDSSQSVAVEEVRRGRNLVIQGPPGTGKSQTIANLIAAAVKDGKTVLFVAEKMAALEVVKRRLDAVDLGSMCLEIHSNKVNKRVVAQELGRTFELGQPKERNVGKLIDELTLTRDQLNAYVETLHKPLEPSGQTPYRIISQLVHLQSHGATPPDFQLENVRNWTSADFKQRLDLLRDVIVHWKNIGKPDAHPWRGVGLAAILPTDVTRLLDQVQSAMPLLDDALTSEAELAKQLNLTSDLASAQPLASNPYPLAKHLAAAPPMDRAAITSAIWQDRREEISQLTAEGKRLAEIHYRLKDIVVDAAWSTDLTKTRRDLAAYGKSWFRWFYRDYREAVATLRGILKNSPPKSLEERLSIVDDLIAGQHIIWEIDVQPSSGELGKAAFGSFWRGSRSDWTAISAIDAWENTCRAANLPTNFRQILAGIDDLEQLRASVAALEAKRNQLFSTITPFLDGLKFDAKTAFGASDLQSAPLAELHARFAAWQSDPEGLTKWINFRTRWERLKAEGLAPLADEIIQEKITPDTAVDRLEMAYNEQLLRAVYEESPILREFNGQSHWQTLERFRELDRQRIFLARYEVAKSHYDRIPSDGDIGEVGLIRREINKKRAHKPLRRLLAEAGHAVQAAKPVFMMSPISVAQFLEPGVLSFDLLLIDEASQVKPVDALGAICRAKQIVVVGDDKQLPPTRFFDKMLGDSEADDEEHEFSAGDVESILGLCCAQGLPSRMLRWHYRSRHQSLIAVSNHEFYEDRLYVIPSPEIDCTDMGLRFHYIADGVFDRGGTATNRVEAQAVAKAVIEHARKSPELSLGVGAFSVVQRDAILDELEVLRRASPETEPFFAAGGAEPFFVKNLENIQGDERDVIFISVGYGRDAAGHMTMSFGPLQADGGERRLNVLISRAKRRCEVFSSITADDIDLSRARSRGAAALKTFLTYAQRGVLDLNQPTAGDAGDGFELEVADALKERGLEVDRHVGIAGFFIDLAVRDPDRPGRYLLGIECDGPSYFAARSARDRDRLRQQVLEDRGWRLHRLWSTDWFQRRDDELRRLLEAIDNALEEPAAGKSDAHSGPHIRPEIAREAEPAASEDNGTKAEQYIEKYGAEKYEIANFKIPKKPPLAELDPGVLMRYAIQVVQIEGPIHQDEIQKRLIALSGANRASKHVSDAILSALELALRQGRLKKDGIFFQDPAQSEVKVRNRAGVSSTSLRKPEMLPPAEIRQALLLIITKNLGVPPDEALTECARLLGFSSTTPALKLTIQDQLTAALQSGDLVQRQDKIYLAQPIT